MRLDGPKILLEFLDDWLATVFFSVLEFSLGRQGKVKGTSTEFQHSSLKIKQQL